MKQKFFFSILFLGSVAILAFFVFGRGKSGIVVSPVATPGKEVPSIEIPRSDSVEGTSENLFVSPLERASLRVTKKPFGMRIDSKTSPVQPERFAGYHTGTDFETFPDEASTDVSVRAICSGTLVAKRMASGYGGVVVESCLLENSPITVVYGHVNLTSITARVGDTVKQGQILGNLGKGYSSETDGERKHLHLGIHKGASVNILGYVNKKSALVDFVDLCLYICGK